MIVIIEVCVYKVFAIVRKAFSAMIVSFWKLIRENNAKIIVMEKEIVSLANATVIPDTMV